MKNFINTRKIALKMFILCIFLTSVSNAAANLSIQEIIDLPIEEVSKLSIQEISNLSIKDWLEIISKKRKASLEIIKRNFRFFARKFHSDKNLDKNLDKNPDPNYEETMKKLNNAKQKLKDEEEYDIYKEEYEKKIKKEKISEKIKNVISSKERDVPSDFVKIIPILFDQVSEKFEKTSIEETPDKLEELIINFYDSNSPEINKITNSSIESSKMNEEDFLKIRNLFNKYLLKQVREANPYPIIRSKISKFAPIVAFLGAFNFTNRLCNWWEKRKIKALEKRIRHMKYVKRNMNPTILKTIEFKYRKEFKEIEEDTEIAKIIGWMLTLVGSFSSYFLIPTAFDAIVKKFRSNDSVLVKTNQ